VAGGTHLIKKALQALRLPVHSCSIMMDLISYDIWIPLAALEVRLQGFFCIS
jgi:hypothetical protein